MLDMYKKMVKRQKHKRITRNDYDANHNYNKRIKKNMKGSKIIY